MGDSGAQFNLALMLYRGEGIEEDKAKAANWFLEAAKNGDEAAEFWYGFMAFNRESVEQDQKTGIAWIRSSAQHGYAKAQAVLGSMYAGEVLGPNPAEAAKWTCMAAENGNALSQYNCGVMYGKGSGVEKDLSKALSLFRKA